MPKKRTGLMSKINAALGVTKSTKDKHKASELMQAPKKEKVMPKFNDFQRGASVQVDLLYLPNDNGYKYVLTAVDDATRLADAEPIKGASAKVVLAAFKRILKRKYIQKPTIRLESDGGGEFKGEFQKWLTKNGIDHKVGRAGRSRQQALVESMNKLLGVAVFTKMNADELRTGEESKDWVADLPTVIRVYNGHVKKTRKPAKERMEEVSAPKCSGQSCELLENGDRVHVVKEKPTSIVGGRRQAGKFRATDLRWETQPRTIVKVIVRGGSPPLYKVSGIDSTVFPREQLKLASKVKMGKDESTAGKFVPSKVVDKKKMKGRIHYRVRWKGFQAKDDTWEPHSKFNKDRPDLVKSFNQSR
jgi:hypothetical protein